MAMVGDEPGCGFEQYTADVYGWAYRLLGRHHDALDVVQDVFLRWDEQCSRETPSRARGWLRRVTLNRAVDMHRERAKTGVPLVEAAAREDEVSARSETSDRDTLRQDIAAGLDRLTDPQRSVLVAKVYDELTFAEIAAESGLAVSTVKTHYLRAVRAMRDRLQPRWSEETER